MQHVLYELCSTVTSQESKLKKHNKPQTLSISPKLMWPFMGVTKNRQQPFSFSQQHCHPLPQSGEWATHTYIAVVALVFRTTSSAKAKSAIDSPEMLQYPAK